MIARVRFRKAVNDFPRAHEIQFLSGQLFEVMIVLADPRDALAQCFVILLETIVLLIELVFLAA